MKTGSCVCGEVSFEIHGPMDDAHACHCSQCRKMTGNYWISTHVADADLKFTKEKRVQLPEKVKVFPIPAPRHKKVELVAKAEVHKKNSDTSNNNNNYTTFTQLGFAKKHLMLEKYTDF